MSSTFLSTIGILIGDTSSPILWTLYLADFCLRADIDDVTLSSIVVTHLEQADDIIFLSKTAAGAQRKMNAFLSWCKTNFMMINAIKSSIMIFGPTSAEPVPCFYFGEDQVTVSSEQTYVGVTVISPKIGTRQLNIFEEHYTKKASKARVIGNAIFGLESMIGVLPPWEEKKLYMALVDPHLIHGCEVSLDTNKTSLAQLEEIQVYGIRRSLEIRQDPLPLIRCFSNE